MNHKVPAMLLPLLLVIKSAAGARRARVRCCGVARTWPSAARGTRRVARLLLVQRSCVDTYGERGGLVRRGLS